MNSAWPTPLGATIAPTPHAVRALANERRRGWVERAGACAPRAPMWTSRAAWLDGLQSWAQSPALGRLCAAERVSITAATLLSIASVMAEHADHATGRHVAVTRATIASRVGCDVRTVTAAWRVLRASQWAIEAQRGHGSPGTPSVGRRPSVYHLVPRRDPSLANRPAVHDFHLPPSGGVSSFTPVGRNSPSERASAPANQNLGKGFNTRAVPRRTAPRPLTIQRLAAALVAGTHGLDRVHIGAICDALTAADIDPTIWTARAITDALNADMRTRGWTWPDHIPTPGAFLSSRLRRLSWSPPDPSTKAGGYAAASIDQTPRPEPLTDTARARIAAAQKEIRRVLHDRAHRAATEPAGHTRNPRPTTAGRPIVRPVTAPTSTDVERLASRPAQERHRWRINVPPTAPGPHR
ncbi:MAG: rep protein [Mycobacterium sp.]|nr:rep protein [Mycobacterium sp.]